MIVDNPYVKELQLAIKNDDRKAESEALAKFRSFTSAKLSEAKTLLDDLISKHKSFSVDNQGLSLNKQYKNSIELYKSCRDLLLDIRQLKKSIRELQNKKGVLND